MDGVGSTKFIISAAAVAEMASAAGLSPLSLLPTLVHSSRPLARPPISTFHVASVGLASDGRVFIGVNLEFPGVPLHHSVHSEQFLVSSLAAHGGGRLLAFAVSAAPCGHCRQFLQELRSASELQICITDGVGEAEFRPLISILPSPFGPFDLLDSRSPLLLEPIHNRLSLLDRSVPVTALFSSSGKPNCHPLLGPDCYDGLAANGFSMGEKFVLRSDCDFEEQTAVIDYSTAVEKLIVGRTSDSENGPVVTDVSIDGKQAVGPTTTAVASTAANVQLSTGKLGLGPTSNYDSISVVAAPNTDNTGGLCNGHCEPSFSQLEIGALEAANKSHAPYSNCPSGVALMDCEGNIYKGSYMESAAYNPSLGPVQAAVVAYVAAGGGGYDRIVAGVLVEKDRMVVRQEDTARLLLKLIAPKCELRVIHCRSD